MNGKRRDGGGGGDLSTSVALELGDSDGHVVLSTDVICQCVYRIYLKGHSGMQESSPSQRIT